MALPPTIPTSFVPKQRVEPSRRTGTGTNLFLLASAVVVVISVVTAGGIFGYEKFLESVRDSKSAKLTEAEASINRDTVEDFIRLRDRFASTRTLLDQHVALSQFFVVLEEATVQNVQFDSLRVSVGDDRVAKIDMAGSARSFNALAVESAVFAGEKHIRRAIFSGISTKEDGSVSFTLSAELDPRLVVTNGENIVAPSSVQTSPVPAPSAPISTSTAPLRTSPPPSSATTTQP